MLTPLKPEILKVDDLSHEARKFRTVLWSFERNLELLFQGSGISASVDHAALATAFSNWRLSFDKFKHLAGIDRAEFVVFAAGLMLKELIAAAPLKTAPSGASPLPAAPVPPDHPLARWPEGYAYTSYCLSVADAVLKEEGGEERAASPASDRPGFWDTFRENAIESPSTAIAFFDLVCGRDPNWDAPDVPWMRKAFGEAAARLSSRT